MILGPYKKKILLIRAGILMTLTEIGLRTAGFKRCKKVLWWMARWLPFSYKKEKDLPLTLQVTDIVDRAARTTSIYPAQCLSRSLVLHYFLQRYGQSPRLQLGVQTITGKFRAHAWVECHGMELNEDVPANELYVPLEKNSPRRMRHHH